MPDLDHEETLFAEANEMTDRPAAEIRAAFFRATPGTPEYKRYVVLGEQRKRYQGTLPSGYRTKANGDYAIMTVQLHKGDWIATTREFKAFGATEADAIAQLGRYLQEAGESILKLAHKMMGLGA